MTLFDIPPPDPPPEPGAPAKCRRCNRPIRDPVSLGYRIGPECRHRLGIAPLRKPPRIGSVRWRGPVEGQQDLIDPKINDEGGEQMTEITYHEAHAPYIEAVAGALDAAGLTVGDWHADANDPRDGCITLAGRDEDGDQRCAGWDEEKGWFYGTSPEDGHGEIQSIWWICDDVLPDPAGVVAAVQQCIAGDRSRATRDHGYYRDFEDDEDGFEERLAAYHPKAEAASGEGESR